MSHLSRACALATTLLALAAPAAPSLVIVNAQVFTADPARPRAEAVAVEGARIAAVGRSADIRALAGPGTRIVDAGGRRLVPGLVEAHVHLGQELPAAPLALPGLPFPGPSAEQALAAVEAAARQGEGWIGAYVGPALARDGRNWRAALDLVAPDRPVLLRGFWGHTTLVNSAGLQRLGIADDVADPLGGWWGRDAQGRLDGRAFEAAETLVPQARPMSPDELASAYAEAAGRYARWGVTSIHLMNSEHSLPLVLQALARAGTPQKWTIYAWATPAARVAQAWERLEALGPLPPRVRVEGPKWVLDGTPLEQNAHQRADYHGRPGWTGRSNFGTAELRELLGQALRSPHQMALHVVGDAETDRLLALMRELAPPAAWRAKRVRIEHGDGVREDSVAAARALGLTVIQNPTHLPPPPEPGRPPLIDRPMLLRGLMAAGLPLALGSDGGVDEQNPYVNLLLATTYAGRPAEALSRAQALRAYTAGGAYAERQEARKGRIAPGLAADLALLSQDVLTVPAERLPATTSLLTLVDGVVVFEDPALAGSGPQ
ncbi:amidohydrolase [Roseateles sp.]|uniref:amidohydrolase n=1 Tax=Roseateles sp. TaxID=1971397 RepID=UPI0025D457AA|nr:amidohydrolase family protein [Roseateles sp.]MBV8036620.1 amidohydrolase family protein [Roseateles sp.]